MARPQAQETGNLRDCSYSYVGFFFLGPYYLLFKGRVRPAAEYVAAMLALLLLFWAAGSYLDPYGVAASLLSVVEAVAPLALVVWFLQAMPRIIVRDLFVSGYSPEDEGQWGALERSGILSDRQLASFRGACGSRPGAPVAGRGASSLGSGPWGERAASACAGSPADSPGAPRPPG